MNICFTGHRPNKLGGYDWHNERNIRIGKKVSEVVLGILQNKEVDVFYFGGALGIDQMAYAIVEKLKVKHGYTSKMIVAIPFKNQPCSWNSKDQQRFQQQLKRADEVIMVDALIDTKYYCDLNGVGNYHIGKMQIRNKYMVDNSDCIIAVWDGTKSGTGNCINYAKKCGKHIIVVDPRSLMIQEINKPEERVYEQTLFGDK